MFPPLILLLIGAGYFRHRRMSRAKARIYGEPERKRPLAALWAVTKVVGAIFAALMVVIIGAAAFG